MSGATVLNALPGDRCSIWWWARWRWLSGWRAGPRVVVVPPIILFRSLRPGRIVRWDSGIPQKDGLSNHWNVEERANPPADSAWMGCKECTYIQIFFVRRPKPSQKGKFKLGGPWHVVPKGQNAVVRFPARFPWRGGVIYRVSLPIDGRSLGCKMGSAWFNSSPEIEFWVIWIQKLFRI